MNNFTGSDKKERILYVDALRGFAIFIVVYSHVVFHSFHLHTTLNEIISTIHMPIFFLISGYVVKKWNISSFQIYFRLIGQKFISLVVLPTIVGLIYTYAILDSNLFSYITDIMKFGYWFTISLFEMYTILLTIILFVNKSTQNLYRKEISLGLLFLISICLWISMYAFANSDQYYALVKTICVRQTSLYLPFFCLGLFLQLKENQIEFMSKKLTVLLATICFIILSFVNLRYIDKLNIIFPSVPIGGLLVLLIGFTGSISIYLLFSRLKNNKLKNTFIGKSLTLFGINTLTIYLLHYFLLYIFSPIEGILNIGNNVIVDFIVCIVYTVLIIVSCISIQYCVNKLRSIIYN
jgi:peptidoglycan/LPS O-acetylase OafA/YrhL